MIRPNPRKPRSFAGPGTGDLSNGARPPKSLPPHSSTPFLTDLHSNSETDHPKDLPFVPFSSSGTEFVSSRCTDSHHANDHDVRPWSTPMDSRVFVPQEISTRVTSPSTFYPSIGSPVNWKHSSPTNQFRGFVPIHGGDESREGTPVFGSHTHFFKTPTRKASPTCTIETVSLSTSPDTLGSYDRSCGTPSSLAAAAAASQASIKVVKLSNSIQSPYSRPCSTIPPSKRSSLQAAASGSNRVDRPKSAPTVVAAGQAADEDCSRKVRLKTELCMHYETGGNCPFGDNCTYAHGEEELQMTKLVDLHDAGLVDMDTHRVKPCWTWTATGSCPFGRRCTNIHDTRCGDNGVTSWLPHTETQGNTTETDINVESLYQKRQNAIIHNNPFGRDFQLTSSTFEDLYNLVNGIDRGSRWYTITKTNQRKTVHPIYQLQIALKIRGKDSDWHYKYRPQHLVHDQLCMVLQKHAYRVQTNDHNQSTRITSATATAISSVIEISLNLYDPNMANHILVHEIAFGPDSDPTVRGVALWFNINQEEVSVCTQQQAKRFRWKKQGSSVKKRVEIATIFDTGTLESFPMIRPHDTAAYHLATEMIKHRMAILKRELMVNLKERHENLEKLAAQLEYLKQRFANQRRSWMAWAWPNTLGRMLVDANTPVPKIEGPYTFDDTECNAKRIWDSYVDTFDDKIDATTELKRTRSGLFRRLAEGISVDKEATGIPHIIAHRAYPLECKCRDQEQCWEALLLQNRTENVWEIVRDHFEKSRSRKVLSMVQ